MTTRRHISILARVRTLLQRVIAVIAFTCVAQSAGAQGLAQVSVAGIPPVLSSPAVSDLAVGFEQGRFPMSIVFTAPHRRPVEFGIRFHLEMDGQTVFDVTSNPVALVSGVHVYTSFDDDPAITFPITYQEIVALADPILGQDVSRTGILSEGLYTLTVEAVPVDPSELLLQVPGVSTFFVQYLEPPVLLSPEAASVLSNALPVFSWMPVLGGPAATLYEYEFVLVEVLDGQLPQQAVESNRPIEEAVVIGQTVLAYTADRLPLEAGKRYAWQITARDADGSVPFTDDGRSEIGTFVYAPPQPTLAEWSYPFSDVPVHFNLAGAVLTADGYEVDGLYRGRVGFAEISALFHDVVIDPVTLAVRDGRIELVEPLAQNAGALDSDALAVLTSDQTGPSAPFVSVRRSGGAGSTLINVVVGPAEDEESGIVQVDYRVAAAGSPADAPAADDVGRWSTLMSAKRAEAFAGRSFRAEVPEGAREALDLGWLELQVRVVNGLGLATYATGPIASTSDISPPRITSPTLQYTGFYDRDRPHVLDVFGLQVTDAESGIAQVEYRIAGGDWVEIARPGANAYAAPGLSIALPAVGADTVIDMSVRAINAAGLSSAWSGSVVVDIDETPPARVTSLARFIESETDPRLELRTASVVDEESGIQTLSYRVVDARRPTRAYVDWREFPASENADVKRTELNFAARQDVQVEVRAENGAGLRQTFTEVVSIPSITLADESPPTRPSVSARVIRATNAAGETLIEVRIGSSSDPETGVERVEYRAEDGSGRDLTGWRRIEPISGGTFTGAIETLNVRLRSGQSAVRVIVRATNGAGTATTGSARLMVSTEDVTPPEIRGLQAYARDNRILIFVDGLADRESFIERLEYRFLTAQGSVVIGWTDYRLVPGGRSSYGRQLVRLPIPDTPASEIIVQVRAMNGVGMQTTREASVKLGL